MTIKIHIDIYHQFLKIWNSSYDVETKLLTKDINKSKSYQHILPRKKTLLKHTKTAQRNTFILCCLCISVKERVHESEVRHFSKLTSGSVVKKCYCFVCIVVWCVFGDCWWYCSVDHMWAFVVLFLYVCACGVHVHVCVCTHWEKGLPSIPGFLDGFKIKPDWMASVWNFCMRCQSILTTLYKFYNAVRMVTFCLLILSCVLYI